MDLAMDRSYQGWAEVAPTWPAAGLGKPAESDRPEEGLAEDRASGFPAAYSQAERDPMGAAVHTQAERRERARIQPLRQTFQTD